MWNPSLNVVVFSCSLSFSNTHALNYRWVRIDDGSKYDEPAIQSDKYNQQFQMSIKYLLHAFVK